MIWYLICDTKNHFIQQCTELVAFFFFLRQCHRWYSDLISRTLIHKVIFHEEQQLDTEKLWFQALLCHDEIRTSGVKALLILIKLVYREMLVTLTVLIFRKLFIRTRSLVKLGKGRETSKRAWRTYMSAMITVAASWEHKVPKLSRYDVTRSPTWTLCFRWMLRARRS